ncbi:hypothetical protein WUBG_19108, partial [Wuchereria bancrofti]
GKQLGIQKINGTMINSRLVQYMKVIEMKTLADHPLSDHTWKKQLKLIDSY